MRDIRKHQAPFKGRPVATGCVAEETTGADTATITAVPTGEWWRIKAVSASGETTLLGRFDGRLPALGAAVLLAEQVGAQVVP
jgi:hypothetical protein